MEQEVLNWIFEWVKNNAGYAAFIAAAGVTCYNYLPPNKKESVKKLFGVIKTFAVNYLMFKRGSK